MVTLLSMAFLSISFVYVCYNVIGLTGYRAVVDGAMRRMPFNVPK